MKRTDGIAFAARAGGDIPEQLELSFATTSFQGGNHSHGASAELMLSSENGRFTILVETGDGEKVFAADSADMHGLVVRIGAYGDWEIGGLAEALVELGLKTWPLVHERKLERENYDAEE